VGQDDHDDAIWNARKDFNNCYSYALNLGPEDTPAGIRRPGFKKFGKCQDIPTYGFCEPSKPGVLNMRDAIASDGVNPLIQVNSGLLSTVLPKPPTEKGLHNIAAFLHGADFHFYRQHPSGLWSYKSGIGGEVRHHSPNGCGIVDPRQDFFDASQQPPNGVFCGFYLVERDAIDAC